MPVRRAIGSLLLCLLLCHCAHRPESQNEQAARITGLSHTLHTLAPAARAQRAEQVARVAVITAAGLRRQYGVRLAPWLHNVEVNAGSRSRGLCFHYARDLASALQPQLAPEWQLHFVQAKPKEILEHNAIVITARGQPWQSGIVLDGWRNAGVLYYGPVLSDHYPWQLKSGSR